jgi:hypothetical protein
MARRSTVLFTERVLWRLEQAEARELDPHLQDDYRIAWITVLYAAQGSRQPDIAATYRVLGLHPDRVWSAIPARRKALLGSCYAEFWGERASSVQLPPKKAPQSERRQRPSAHAAG